MRGCLRIVSFDLDDFLTKIGSWSELRYDVAVEAADEYGVFQRLVLRIYGVDAGGAVVVYEDARVLKRFGDEERMKTVVEEWSQLVEKLGAKPGRVECVG